MSDTTQQRYTNEEWEYLRKRFFNSILIDTEITKLAQNVGASWPFKGTDETPAKYIEYDFDDLGSLPGLVNKTKRVHLLMDIMRETLAFDDPFTEMVDVVQAESDPTEGFDRTLARLEIPTIYPAKLINFSRDTRELLAGEEVETLADVIDFTQNMAKTVVLGGELKFFLNAVAHREEAGIARHLPYRIGHKGLHLAEAIGHVAENLPAKVKLALLYEAGATLSAEEDTERETLARMDYEAAMKWANDQIRDLCDWFTKEGGDLKDVIKHGSPERFFLPLNDPRQETLCILLARDQFGYSVEGKRKGIGSFFGRFKR